MTKSNWAEKTVFTGDNLPVMRGMNSESVDLIYLDPPFNSKANYAAPIGSMAAGAEFKDTWSLSDVDVAWVDLIETRHPALGRVIQAALNNSDKSYLIYMAVRLLEMKRILKPTGSIYLHCDPTMSHYLKLLMDVIFGRKNFRNEIVWHYRRWTGNAKKFQQLHDIIFFYTGDKDYTFNPQYTEYTEGSKQRKEQGVLHRFKEGEEPVLVSNKSTDKRGVRENDVWHIPFVAPSSKERVGYPTQKPLALLDRIIKASSNEGDVVFDPFCGCATTLVAADILNRNWVGVDISPKAVELVTRRIEKHQGLFRQIVARKDIPQRTDVISLRPYNSIDNKKTLYGEQGGDCNGCGEHFEIRHLEIDHIIAKTQGGTDHLENLQLLCGNCNRIKGNRGQEYLLAKLEGRKVAYAG